MTNAIHAALQAALDFHKTQDSTTSDEAVVQTAKKFYRELFVTAPSAAEDWDEGWFNRVHVWLRTLSGDQLGSVSGALQNVTSEREMMSRGALQDWPNVEGPLPQTPMPQVPVSPRYVPAPPFDPSTGRPVAPMYAPVPQPTPTAPGVMPSASKLLDQLNQTPYQGPAPIGPVLVPGELLRIRPEGADVYTTATVAAKLEFDPAEGFRAFVPPGAFSDGKRDEIQTESVNLLLKLLAPAKLSGTIAQQIKELVGTVERQRQRIRSLEESREAFEGSIRVLLHAQNESESDDHYCPEQPTLDALVRVLQRLMADESRIDGSMTQSQVLEEIQQGWHEDGHKELKS